MLIVQVFVQVKAGLGEAFKEATVANASQSVLEPGVARFDLLQQQDDASRFTLLEVYRDAEAPGRHKETAHYARWRETVEPMMAEPRRSVKYETVCPESEHWG